MTATTDSSATAVLPVDQKVIEPDCGQATAKHFAQMTPSMYTKLPLSTDPEGLVPAEWLPTLGDWSALITTAEVDVDDYIAAHADTFLEPGAGWDGCEAPVQRAVLIALRNGLRVTSTARVSGSTESDHHVDQSSAFAADLSDSMERTPRTDRAARQIASALGVNEWDAGVPLVCERDGIRALLIWGAEGHDDHIHFGCRRVASA